MRHTKSLLAFLSAAILAGAGVAGARLLSRPDRIRLQVEMERLHHLHDAILRFKLDRERLPASLSELIPAYAPASALTFRPDGRSSAESPIAWDVATGRLGWSVPFRIGGVFPRTENFTLSIPSLPVIHDPLQGENAFRQVQAAATLGPEDIVVEAELFQSLSYGWEIEESESASGHSYVHLKEGVGDINYAGVEFDPKHRSGDFYNITRNNARIEARCYFLAPASGDYFFAMRTKAERSVCSNFIMVTVDDKEFQVGQNRTEPFVWLWHLPGHIHLEKGMHALALHTYQDGVSVDQAIFTLKRMDLTAAGTFSGGYPQGTPRPDGTPPLTLSLSVDTLSITTEKSPSVAIYIRSNDLQQRRAKLFTSLDLPGGRTRERSYEIDLPAGVPLVKFPCDTAMPRPLDKREYLLRCRIVAGDAVIQERTMVLGAGYDWSILGPLPFMDTAAEGQPERAEVPAPSYTIDGTTTTWRAYSDSLTDHFGIMDFGKMFCGRTYDAIPSVSLYAYTEIDVPRGGDYLLKAQGDDHLVVWINGAKAATLSRIKESAIRSSEEIKVALRAGRNRILFRLNQVSGQWQASIRFRTAADQVADISGFPFARQSVRLSAPAEHP